MGIPYMTNKTKNKQRRRRVAMPQKQKKTPFADVGGIVGEGLGNLLGFKGAKNIGKWLGSGIGSIFGSGDYQMVGRDASYNILTNDRQIPKFEASERTNIVCHREYLQDILSTSGFSNRGYRINPGDAQTFPWLSQVAQQYQQYRIHGMIFEFRPLTTDYAAGGVPGVVVMATNYNAADPLYASKVEMENSEYAVSVKPTLPMIHAIECASNETTLTKLYVDQNNQLDPRFSDMGTFQFASQAHGTDGAILGELWVSYCIEFFKPKLQEEISALLSAEVTRGGATTNFPLGLTPISNRGSLITIDNPYDIAFKAVPGTSWLIEVNWIGTVAATFTILNNVTYTGCLPENILFNNQQWCWYSSDVGETSKRLSLSICVKRDTSGAQMAVGFSSAIIGTLPGGDVTCTYTVTRVNNFL
jgi:hypothetical protein